LSSEGVEGAAGFGKALLGLVRRRGQQLPQPYAIHGNERLCGLDDHHEVCQGVTYRIVKLLRDPFPLVSGRPGFGLTRKLQIAIARV